MRHRPPGPAEAPAARAETRRAARGGGGVPEAAHGRAEEGSGQAVVPAAAAPRGQARGPGPSVLTLLGAAASPMPVGAERHAGDPTRVAGEGAPPASWNTDGATARELPATPLIHEAETKRGAGRADLSVRRRP